MALLGLSSMLLPAEEPAAGVLESVSGTATVTYPDRHSARAQVFDWLTPGTLIQTGPAARVLIVLENGQRYELSKSSRARLEKGSLHRIAGNLRPLPALAAMPKLAAIADTLSTTRGGVVRIRGPKLKHCYPVANAAILSSRPVLTFEPIPAVTSYLIEIENDEGTVIHRTQSSGTPVTLAAGILKPGSKYYWEVRGVVSEADGPQCGAGFSVLPLEDETRRAALETAVRKAGDPDSLALLAEIDRRLGLLREARDEFTGALEVTSTPETIRPVLKRIEAAMR
jgi:hypothetical protein